jgi:hypothetical protein
MVPILDPLFVSGFAMNDDKVDAGFSNVLIRGLKDLDLKTVR